MFWKKRLYFDYAATTSLDRRVFKAMKPWLKDKFANPSSLYMEGVKAGKALTEARKDIASVLQSKPDEIFFTGGGTEANNVAILGTFFYQKNVLKKEKIHFVTTSIEHSSVLEVFRHIENIGGSVTYVPPEDNGIVRTEKIDNAITEDTVLVSVMYANNEIGTIQPIRDIGKIINTKRESGQDILFHTDACQAASYLSLLVNDLNVDLMVIDSSKIYGPKGVGALYKRRAAKISPILFGGGQESGLRSGTENVAGIVGFAKALELAKKLKEKESAHLTILRDKIIRELMVGVPGLLINGDRDKRLPNNINICKLGMDAEYVVMRLDALGIALSSVTTCKTLSDNPSSYVMEELYKKKDPASCSKSSLRITLGRFTTEKEVLNLINILLTVLNK